MQRVNWMFRSMKMCLLSILITVLATVLLAQTSKHGLMWNRTGLPAVFPLQVKTSEGSDYLMTLTDAASGKPSLAAFIEGGRFFKVLVPPGRYEVQFESGDEWQEESATFGNDETLIMVLSETLEFSVVDYGTKAGHIIDLTSEGQVAAVKDQFICQRRSIDHFPRPQLPFDEDPGYAYRMTDEGEIVLFPNRLSRDRLSAGTDDPVIPTDFAPYFSNPTFKTRTYPC